jgi:D-tyrosyl-tRNA(Tyr) deacylase
MLVVIQRVKQATLHINEELRAQIGQGLVVLVGIAPEDTQEDIDWLVPKIAQLRIFADEEGKMNRSVQDIEGDILLVSQFTLHASTKKGNRPSFLGAARPEIAIPLYEQVVNSLETFLNKPIQTGEFGADMQINLTNDGPVTIIIDSKDRK